MGGGWGIDGEDEERAMGVGAREGEMGGRWGGDNEERE